MQLDLCKYCYTAVIGGLEPAWCQCTPPEFQADSRAQVPHWHLSSAEWAVCSLCGEHFGSRLEAPGGYLEVFETSRVSDHCDCDPYGYRVAHNNGGRYHDTRLYGVLTGVVESAFHVDDEDDREAEYFPIADILTAFERRQEEMAKWRARQEELNQEAARAAAEDQTRREAARNMNAEEKAALIEKTAGIVPAEWIEEIPWDD